MKRIEYYQNYRKPPKVTYVPDPKPDPYNWFRLARPKQRVPQGDWTVWLLLAGRGFGKTRTGAETIKLWVKTKACQRIALVGHTVEEARSVMVEGESGLLGIYPPKERPTFVRCKGEVVWPCGAKAFLYSADHYEKLRGPQFDGAWVDELAKFRHAQKAWDQLMFGMRLGAHSRVIVTTTPRPTPLIKRLMYNDSTYLTQGSSYENLKNLSPIFVNQILKAYEGTTLGAQEIYAQILEQADGALWRRSLFQYGA